MFIVLMKSAKVDGGKGHTHFASAYEAIMQTMES